jgi:hypothetical protein
MSFDTARRYLIVTTVSLAMLYGSTYQQFRYFDLATPGGATDAVHYVQMAGGRAESEPELRHRWLTPALASLVEPLARRIVSAPEVAIALAFYAVNFAFSLASCVALFALLTTIGFAPLLSLVGVAAFASSRTTVLVTGTPMVDAAYFCAISLLVSLTLANKLRWLAILMPCLVLSKETVLPFLLLPLLTEMRRSRLFWISLAVSILAYVTNSYLMGTASHAEALPIVSASLEHLADVAGHLKTLFTPSGLHDLQSGFSLWLPLAAAGAWLNRRHHYRDVPLAVVATMPIAFALALLSGNLGRMFFACYPAVIVYALIAIEHVMNRDTLLPPHGSVPQLPIRS